MKLRTADTFKVTLRTDEPQTSGDDHERLANVLLDEMAVPSTRDWISAFRAWHRDALSLIHLTVLCVLEQGPLSMGHLAEALDVSVASGTGIVDRMEQRGLVERMHVVGDRRVWLVQATERGAQVVSGLEEPRRERLRILLASLTPDELAGLLTGLRALHEARGTQLARESAEPATGIGVGTSSPSAQGDAGSDGRQPGPSIALVDEGHAMTVGRSSR